VGSQSTNSSGYATFSGHPKGVAPDLQAFLKGLGTGGETWSGVITQYCEGISTGAQSCPASNTSHVAYPTGGALAGVWEDTSSAASGAATAHQLAQEAENAATHFGKTTTGSNLEDRRQVRVDCAGFGAGRFAGHHAGHRIVCGPVDVGQRFQRWRGWLRGLAPIVTNPGTNTVTVTNPGNQTSTVGAAVSLRSTPATRPPGRR
jgi:hypothetical protein